MTKATQHSCKGCTDEIARHLCDCLDYCPDDKGVDCPVCLSAAYSHKCQDRAEQKRQQLDVSRATLGIWGAFGAIGV